LLNRLAPPSATGPPNRALGNRTLDADEARIASVLLMRVSAGREMAGRTNPVRVLQDRHIACILADFVDKPTDNARSARDYFRRKAWVRLEKRIGPGLRR
jgi:hypothetical protein